MTGYNNQKTINVNILKTYLKQILSNKNTNAIYINDKIDVFISRCHKIDWSSYANNNVSIKAVHEIAKELLDIDTEHALFELINNNANIDNEY